MTKIITSTGATIEMKDKEDVMKMIDEAESERDRIAAERGIDPDKVQIQHISMDSFDFSTADQILKHNTNWKKASDKSQKRGKNAPEGDSPNGVM